MLKAVLVLTWVYDGLLAHGGKPYTFEVVYPSHDGCTFAEAYAQINPKDIQKIDPRAASIPTARITNTHCRIEKSSVVQIEKGT